MMGRKQKLLSESKGHLRVVEQEAKYKAEFLAADGLKRLQPTPPTYLDRAAKLEYKRIYKGLGKLPIRDLDHAEIENYCTWYSIYKVTSKQLAVVNKPSERDALIKTLDKATRNIKSLASDLGLNVNSRLQMNMPKEDKKGPQSLKERFG